MFTSKSFLELNKKQDKNLHIYTFNNQHKYVSNQQSSLLSDFYYFFTAEALLISSSSRSSESVQLIQSLLRYHLKKIRVPSSLSD